jgi:hypothetical protein
MAKTGRNIAVIAVIGGTLMATPRAVTAADADGMTTATVRAISHLRSGDLGIVSLIERATEQSATFRHLVHDIDASDSYVYVNAGTCGHGVRACFTSVTASGSKRYMWVKVDKRTADSDLMGSIGHELRHTLEAIAEPSVRSDAAKFFLYQRIGHYGTNHSRETQAAMDTGNAIRSEVRALNSKLTRDSN